MSGIFFCFLLLYASCISLRIHRSRYVINCRHAIKRFLTFRRILRLFLPLISVENAQSWRHDRVDLTSSDVTLICSIRLYGVPLRVRGYVSLTGASIHASSLRGKRASARLLSSLPHYSIMMACGVCRTPSALPSQRSTERALLPPSPPPLSSLFSLFSLRRSSSRLLARPSSPGIFLPHSFSPSPFIRRPILVHVPRASFVWRPDGETRVHIFVTMTCMILRAGANTHIHAALSTPARETKKREKEKEREEREGEGGRGREKVR